MMATLLRRPKLSILQINTHDIEGGAAKVSWDLFKSYQQLGHRSWLAVGEKRSSDPDVKQIPYVPPAYAPWANLTHTLSGKLSSLARRSWLFERLKRWSSSLSDPWAVVERKLGREDFNFYGSRRVLGLFPSFPDIVHAHNLHEDYFDLTYLPQMSSQRPFIITLHDAWLISGHCSHSFDCERWRTGCGHCPDITIPPEIQRDATAYNWQRKKRILSACKLGVITPCQWLMDRACESILAPAMMHTAVIPNGIDLTIFRPMDKNEAKSRLGIPIDAKMLLFVASGITKNRFKDFRTLSEALQIISEHYENDQIFMVALGEAGPGRKIGNVQVEFVPFHTDPDQVARYYQAADIYLHAALVDTFPSVIAEAFACGTPVVASSVGGIPEQIDDEVSGCLVPPSNPVEMARKVQLLLNDDERRIRMGQKCAQVAAMKFDLRVQASKTLSFYYEVMSEWEGK